MTAVRVKASAYIKEKDHCILCIQYRGGSNNKKTSIKDEAEKFNLDV